MKANLKYHFLTACLACAAGMLASCSSTAEDDITPPRSPEVTFDVSGLSRAAITTALNRFAVYGDMKFPATGDATPTVTFSQTEVRLTGDTWTYSGEPRYWFPKHEHSFVALHPIAVLEAANDLQYANSKLTFTYAMPSTGDGNMVNDSEVADIVAATHRRLYNENDANTVTSLCFAHLMSLINFSVELTQPASRSEECYKIHKFEMSGFGTSATFNITPAPRLSNSQTDDSEIAITTTGSNGCMEINFAEPITVTNGAESVKMFDGNRAIIMLPQKSADNATVHIGLTYSVNDEAETTEVSATLSGFSWESGKSYNYNIKLELAEAKEVNMVISNATIKPWALIDDHAQVDAK